jgi:hypothetical protein
LYYFSSHGTNTEYGTPPQVLRELREFTTLEKQICNPKVCEVLNYTTGISF